MTDMLLTKTHSSLAQHQVDELFVRWQRDGDESARERLVQHFLPLAYKLARRYRGAHEPINDLRQVAALGLLKAINGFDASRGYKFASYAVPSILGELRRYFRDCGWSVHMPRGIQELALKVEQARRTLDAEHSVVTAQMIAQFLEIPIEDVVDALEANTAHHAMSLDMPVDSDDESTTIGATLGFVDPAFSNAEKGADIARASAVLTEREKPALRLRFESDMTQAEIGPELGVSQMHVSRILKAAIERLSEEMGPAPSAA